MTRTIIIMYYYYYYKNVKIRNCYFTITVPLYNICGLLKKYNNNNNYYKNVKIRNCYSLVLNPVYTCI